jgi:PEP-CTERM motif
MTECDGWVDFMVVFRARSVALAGAIAVGVLCEAVICEPARAVEALAFGASAGLDPVLDLYNGGTLVATVSTSSALGIFQGFISNTDPGASVLPSIGGPNGTNTSYAAGSYNGMLLVDYLGFNLASLPKTVTSITSATLVMESGKVTNNLTYTLFGASQWVTQLETPGDQNAALYANLVKGVGTGFYGSFQVAKTTGSSVSELMFTLNAAAVSDINTAIQNKTVFVVAGQVSAAAVPEPSTWVMMLAGFAGLGIVARRRAAKRRAAAAAG